MDTLELMPKKGLHNETQAKFLCCAIEAIKANPEISGEAESDVVPRDRLDSTEFMGESAAFGMVNQSFQVLHAPWQTLH